MVTIRLAIQRNVFFNKKLTFGNLKLDSHCYRLSLFSKNQTAWYKYCITYWNYHFLFVIMSVIIDSQYSYRRFH